VIIEKPKASNILAECHMAYNINEKIVALTLANVETKLVDLDKGDTLTGTYHMIMSNMTLHHVRDIEQLFSQFYNVSKNFITGIPSWSGSTNNESQLKISCYSATIFA
jgi:hypothetical protein